MVQPNVLVAFGQAAVDALYKGKPPKADPLLGQAIDLNISGLSGLTYAVPVVITHGLDTLRRTRDLEHEDGVWDQTINHIISALEVANTLKELKNA